MLKKVLLTSLIATSAGAFANEGIEQTASSECSEKTAQQALDESPGKQGEIIEILMKRFKDRVGEGVCLKDIPLRYGGGVYVDVTSCEGDGFLNSKDDIKHDITLLSNVDLGALERARISSSELRAAVDQTNEILRHHKDANLK